MGSTHRKKSESENESERERKRERKGMEGKGVERVRKTNLENVY